MKKSTLLFAIMSAGGIPYLASSKNTTPETPASAASAHVESHTPTVPPTSFGSHPATSPTAGSLHAAPVGTPPLASRAPSGIEIHTIPQAFNFDVTPGWVMGNWSRVSSGLADVELQGYRVALVTGTRDDDLAGSLTYYFDAQQQAKRIVFTGNTGDARPLVAWVTSRYGFQREVTTDPSLYLYRVRDGKFVKSELRIRPAGVLRQGESLQRFSVSLVMSRPEE